MNVTTGEGGAMFFFMNNMNGVPYSAGSGTSYPDGYFMRTGAPSALPEPEVSQNPCSMAAGTTLMFLGNKK